MSIVRVCFTSLLPPTFKKDLKRKRNLQINVNSLAMANLYELLCYHSLEHLDPIKDKLLTFFSSTLFELFSPPAISAVLPETTDGIINYP